MRHMRAFSEQLPTLGELCEKPNAGEIIANATNPVASIA
jgi:hypothetical protein